MTECNEGGSVDIKNFRLDEPWGYAKATKDLLGNRGGVLAAILSGTEGKGQTLPQAVWEATKYLVTNSARDIFWFKLQKLLSHWRCAKDIVKDQRKQEPNLNANLADVYAEANAWVKEAKAVNEKGADAQLPPAPPIVATLLNLMDSGAKDYFDMRRLLRFQLDIGGSNIEHAVDRDAFRGQLATQLGKIVRRANLSHPGIRALLKTPSP